MKRPNAIIWFVVSQIISLAVGLYQNLGDWDKLLASYPTLSGNALTVILVISNTINLILLYVIAQKRSNGARWIYIVLTTVGLASHILSLAAPGGGASMLSTLLQFIFGALGIILLLLPASSAWFSRELDAYPTDNL